MNHTTLEHRGRSGRYSAAVWQRRVELAAAYRLTALFKWDDLIATHISARVPGTTDRFLINPYGWLFEEITASSLIEVDIHGQKVEDSPYEVNPAGFTIHSAIHAARHDAECVMHTHTLNGTAVSAQKEGVLPLSQQSMLVLQSLGYHDYEGIALRADEKLRLVASLGKNDFLMLRNHGLLTVGRSVGEAFIFMYVFEAVCNIQVRALAGDRPLSHIDPALVATAREQVKAATQGQGAAMAWPGLLRRLERTMPGYDS
jgi:ribulose-5-phosphate 4-epimerase/fuculose-1-phosphate aldolase